MSVRILVVRCGSAGDVLLATPVIRALRYKYPDSYISMAVELVNTEVIASLTELNEIIGLKDTKEVFTFSSAAYDVQYHLRYEKFPDLHPLDAYSLITGLDLSQEVPVINLADGDRKFATDVWNNNGLTETDIVIGLHRGPTWPIRTWPDKYLHVVVNYLKSRYNVRFIELTSVPGFTIGKGLDLSGQTSFHQLAAVVEKCSMILCVDSLVMHVASAVNTPVVAVFGGTDPDKRLPRNSISIGVQAAIPCHGCHHRKATQIFTSCRYSSIRCMELLTPAHVIVAVEKLLPPPPKKKILGFTKFIGRQLF